MAYTTVAIVKLNHERIPKQNTDLDTAIAKFIVWSDGIINSYIRGKYELPFTTTPPLLEWISTSLSTFFSLKRVVGAQVNDEFYQWIEDYWNKPIEMLKMIKNCEMEIDSEVDNALDMVESSTYMKQPIFDLGPVLDQEYHPNTDRRYGKGYD